MKDVSEKHETHRVAASQALLQMPPEILREHRLEKGGALEMGLTAVDLAA